MITFIFPHFPLSKSGLSVLLRNFPTTYIFFRKRSYHIHTYMWRLAFVRIIYGVFLSYWFAGKHCERCEVYCIHIILLAPLWERLCWVLNLVANGVWFPDSGFVTQSGRSCLHGRQQHHSPAAGGRSLLTLLLLLGHQLTRTHHPWPWCHDGMGLLGRLGVVAKLEQMGGGAQLYHKYSDSCDVQTNSMTNS